MKKIIAITFLLCFIFSMNVFAHSTMISSTPAEGDTITEDLSEIGLQYNTGIESTSKFTVVNENGDQIPVDITIENDKMIGILSSPLDNGTYVVEWDIIGADGHPINGKYPFSVNKAEITNITPPDTPAVTSDKPTTESPVTNENTAQAATDSEEESSNNFMTIGVIVLVAIVVIALFSLMRRNRK